MGSASGFYPQSTVLLTITDTENPDNSTCWIADPDEVTTELSTDFDAFQDSDSSVNTPGTSRVCSHKEIYDIMKEWN